MLTFVVLSIGIAKYKFEKHIKNIKKKICPTELNNIIIM